VLHALVAEDLPGPGTVFLSQDWKFTAPVFIGDTITARAEVLSVHDSKPVCRRSSWACSPRSPGDRGVSLHGGTIRPAPVTTRVPRSCDPRSLIYCVSTLPPLTNEIR
jgi:hypothetical protein